MSEQEQLEEEEARIEAGIPPRDMTEISLWRSSTDQVILESLEVYGCYLAGQSNGLSDSLDLGAVVAVCDIEQVPAEDRPQFAQDMLLIHDRVRRAAAARRKKAGNG